MTNQSNTPTEKLFKICSEQREKLLSLPHPTGAKHQFNKKPLTLLDFAWGSTMYPDWAKKNLPIVEKALANA